LPSSNRDELDVYARGQGERAQILDVGGENVVPVVGEGDERGIDGIDGARRFEQHARAATQLRINRSDLHARQEPGDLRLPSCPSTPDLRDDSAMCLGGAIQVELGFDERNDVSIMALDRKKGPGIE
jgi:hypothetical protein